MLANDMKERVFSHMLDTRGTKFRWFLYALQSFKYLSDDPIRAEFLESYYTLMRYIDDIVDGDAPLKDGYDNAAMFVEEKIEFCNRLKNPQDEVDHLMLYCFDLAAQFREDFKEESDAILHSMLFDAKRRGSYQIFPRDELNHHFHMLDIIGTVKGTIKVFNEDVQKYERLIPLGRANRIYYDMRDFHEDIIAGYVNIPIESVERHGISKRELEKAKTDSLGLESRLANMDKEFSIKSTPMKVIDYKAYSNRKDRLKSRYVQALPNSIKAWFEERSYRGLKLIDEHDTLMKKTKFKGLTRHALKLVYRKPSKNYFDSSLKLLST